MKYLEHKYNQVYSRAVRANMLLIEIVSKDKITDAERVQIKPLREYMHKMFNASYRITRIMQKKRGETKLKPLYRGLFKHMCELDRIKKSGNSEALTAFVDSMCKRVKSY